MTGMPIGRALIDSFEVDVEMMIIILIFLIKIDGLMMDGVIEERA